MRKTLAIMLLLALTLPALAACQPSAGEVFVECGGVRYNVGGVNTDAKNSIYDRNYIVEGVPSVTFAAPSDGHTVTFLLSADGKTSDGVIGDVAKGDSVVIPTNGVVFFTDRDISGNATLEGYNADYEYTDFETLACVTDLDKRLGVTLTHKDVKSLEGCGNVLIQPSMENNLAVPEGSYAVTVSRNIGGTFTVDEADVKKTDKKLFTLIFNDAYSVSFAKKMLTAGAELYLSNTNTITPYGNTKTVLSGDSVFTDVTLNADSESGDGVYVYDDNTVRLVTPERSAEFVDMIVCDGIIAHIGEKNENLIVPHPLGIILSFVGNGTVEKASSLKVGDRITEIGFSSETSPSDYVIIKDRYKVEVNYYNETRTAYSKAVIYDNDSMYTTTRTNEWGTEIAIADGTIVSFTIGATENAGNSAIPDDGYVLSVAMNQRYYSSLTALKKGDSALHVKKESLYVWRTVDDATFNTRTPGSEEYLTIFDSSYGKYTPLKQDVHDYIIDADGFVTGNGADNGYTRIPDGGMVLRVTGMKYNEVSSFIENGMKMFADELAKTVYFLGMPADRAVLCEEKLDSIEQNTLYWRDRLETLDYAKIDSMLSEAREQLKKKDAESLLAAMKTADELYYLSIPSLVLQNRAAWCANTVTTEDGVKQIVDYAKKVGLNTIIIDVMLDQYTTYNTSVPHMQKHASIASDFDVLEAFVRLGHEAGLEVHALYCSFACGGTFAGFDDDHYVSYFKNKMLISNKNRKEAYYGSSPSLTLNMNDSEVKEFLLSVYKEVLENYDIDGLQLDYIRFPLPTVYSGANHEEMGYNDDIIAAYREWSGSKTDPKTLSTDSQEWSKWCEFRRKLVTDFVILVDDLVAKTAPEIKFTVTCFPDYNDRQIYTCQDVELWAEMGIVDGIYPMSYTAVYDDEYTYNSMIIEKTGSKAFMNIGLGTYDGATQDCLARQIALTQLLAADGTCIFALPYINSGEYHRFYSEGAYRNEAVRTDSYDVSLEAGLNDLVYCIDSVYPYLYKNADVNSVLTQVSALLDTYCGGNIAGKSLDERTKWCEVVIAALKDCKDGVDTGEEKVDLSIVQRLDRLIAIIERTLNTVG